MQRNGTPADTVTLVHDDEGSISSIRGMRVLPFAVFLLLFSLASPAADPALSDDKIRDILIERSIASYSGNCPCPHFLDAAGRKCGRRSAYSKPGGASPLCYREDVSEEMVEAFRRKSTGT